METEPSANGVKPDELPAEQATVPEVPPAPPPEEPAEDLEAPYGRKADGTPKAKPGRKAAGEAQFARLESVTQAPPRPPKPAPMAPIAPINQVDYKALGETAATLWFSVPSLVFGEEWEPKDKEPEIIAGAFARYFKAKGVSDIPPGAALALVLISYTGARMQKPTIKTRLFGAVEWIKSKLPSRR